MEASVRNFGITRGYLPALPPHAPGAVTSYMRSVQDAPYTALMGVVVDGRRPDRHPVTPRCRVRYHVGLTNRWRLPESLGSDLLGSAQAIKATSARSKYNKSMAHTITAENPWSNVNLEMDSRAYKSAIERLTKESVLAVASEQKSTSKFQSLSSGTRLTPLASMKKSLHACASPRDIFQYHSQRSHTAAGPDILLKCKGMSWELHRPYLQKSLTLSALLEKATCPTGPIRYYKNRVAGTMDEHITSTKHYTSQHMDTGSCCGVMDSVDSLEFSGVSHPKHISEQRVNHMTELDLDITDPLVTKEAFAVALGNLYCKNVEISKTNVHGVLAAAYALRFKQLIKGCTDMMRKMIAPETVCSYYEAARKYGEQELETACERWLELNIVPKLSGQIELRDISQTLLDLVLKSNRLFTYGEYSLYKVVATWVFLHLNPQLQIFPTFNTVVSYFNSLPKDNSLLDREEGEVFIPLFMSLRLHGITETAHLQDIQTMNIVPQSWIVKILAQHYHALQGGGDMSMMTNFYSGAVRQGFLLEDVPQYHSEVLSLHGFHFELKAVRKEDDKYTFFIQRLKPNDPMLSFRQCEHHTFSMRADRPAKYSIRIQWYNQENVYQVYNTGMLELDFGLGSKCSKSEEVTLDGLVNPVYVTYSLFFPPS